MSWTLITILGIFACATEADIDEDEDDGGFGTFQDGGTSNTTGTVTGGTTGSTTSGGSTTGGSTTGGTTGATSTTTVTTPGGDPVACELTDRAYILDIVNATVVEPAGVGALLTSSLESDFLMGIEAVDGDEIDINWAEDGGGFAECLPLEATFNDPCFVLGPESMELTVSGTSVVVDNFVVAGCFESDCASFRDGLLAGEIDIRNMTDLMKGLTGTDDPDTICALLSSFGASCGSCRSDGEPYCLPLRVEDITGDELDEPLECGP